MKKYVSLVLCVALFLSAFLLNYERSLGGKGKGTNEAVEGIDELSEVVESITKILEFNDIFASNSVEEKYQLLSSSVDEEDSNQVEHESVTIYNEYTAESVVTIGSDSIKSVISGDEVWYVSDGGERLFVKAIGNIRQIGAVSGVSQNADISLEFSLYYEKGMGFFIKYDDLKMSGSAIPGKILNRWISVDSCDGLGIDMDKIFEQLLGKNYTLLQDFGIYLNQYRDDAFSKSGDTYIMETDVYKKFCTDSYNNSADFSEMGITFSELDDVNGELKVDFAEIDAPAIYYTVDMNYGATIDNQTLNCKVIADQKMVITNINNTVVRALEPSSIYDLKDLLR